MFNLVIMAQDGKMEPYEINSITLPTSDGQRTVLSRHMEIYVEVDIGVVKIRKEGLVKRFSVSQGLFHFKDNVAFLTVTTFENEEEVDLERARRAYERARIILESEKNIEELRKAEQALKRALARLNLE